MSCRGLSNLKMWSSCSCHVGEDGMLPFLSFLVKSSMAWAPPAAGMQSASVSDFLGPTDELFSAIQKLG
jgi:hypothetical protein